MWPARLRKKQPRLGNWVRAFPACIASPAIQQAVRWQQRKAQGTVDSRVRADRASLQLIANRLSISQWLQTMSLVRCGLQACHVSLVQQPKANRPSVASR